MITDEGAPFSSGYGVPYGAGGVGFGGAGGFYQPQQTFAGGNYGFGNPFQGNVYDQGQFGGAAGGSLVKHRRRHHRHHHHTTEAVNTGADQNQGIPEYV